MISFDKVLATVVVIATIGCTSNQTPTQVQTIKDTGWVTLTKANYLYHKTLLFSDGHESEFYICSPLGALDEENSVVRIRYEGDGSSIQNCADHVTVEHKPGTRNSENKLITTGTKQVEGDAYAKETLFLKTDGTNCGTVLSLSSNWEAYAYEEMSRPHYFKTRAEAVKFITENWCKP